MQNYLCQTVGESFYHDDTVVIKCLLIPISRCRHAVNSNTSAICQLRHINTFIITHGPCGQCTTAACRRTIFLLVYHKIDNIQPFAASVFTSRLFSLTISLLTLLFQQSLVYHLISNAESFLKSVSFTVHRADGKRRMTLAHQDFFLTVTRLLLHIIFNIHILCLARLMTIQQCKI